MRLRPSFGSLASPLLVCSSSVAASAQRLGGATTPDVSFVRVFLALFVCLIVAVLAVLLLRQRRGTGAPFFLSRLSASTSRIKVVETRRIAPQADLSLVRCDDEEYLLLIAPGGASVLHQKSASNAPETQL